MVAEPVAEPAPVKPAIDPFRHGTKAEANRLQKAKELARWLWDRNIGGEQVLGFTNKWRNKIARAAGVNPPSTLETWTVAAELMERMAAACRFGNPARGQRAPPPGRTRAVGHRKLADVAPGAGVLPHLVVLRSAGGMMVP